MRDRHLGLLAIVAGIAGIALVQRLAPVAAPPLYDGVVVVQPYRWLTPPPRGAGDPTSAAASLTISGAASQFIALATGEMPPQAQIIGSVGDLVLPPGSASINMSITPVAPPAPPADGHIAGNVYRVTLVDQAGVALRAREGVMTTVVLRGPDGTTDATVERYTGSGWVRLKTSPAGFGSAFLAIVTDFGDFALVSPGPAPGGLPTPVASGSAGAASGGSGPAVSPEPSAPGASAGSTDTTIGLVVLVAIAVSAGIGLLVRRRTRRKRRQIWQARRPGGRRRD